MNSNVKVISSLVSALVLIVFMHSGSAFGQAQGNNAQNIPSPQVSQESCSQVQWAPKLLQQYPRIADACQEVITVNGENWARIEGKLIRENPNGSITAMVVDSTGRGMGSVTLKPAPDQKVILEGREVPFNQLQTGAILHLYIPEHMYAVAMEPGAQTEEISQVEEEPSEEVTQSEEQLPATAGPLPWVLLAGGAIALIGLGFTLRRRFSGR